MLSDTPLVERARRLWRRSSDEPQALPGSSGAVAQDRLQALEARIDHLESALEGLQDAVYRREILEDEQMDELRRRTEPAQMARELSEDARRRGL